MNSRRAARLLAQATHIARLEHELALRRAEFEGVAGAKAPNSGPPTQRSEQLLRIAAAVVQLESDIAVRRDGFERLVRADAGEPDDADAERAARSPPPLRPLARTSSLPVRVQSVLDLSARPLTALDVAAQIGEPVDSVRTALSKLHAREAVQRVAPGLYRSNGGGHRKAASEDD
jgi:hypothetical protein